MFSKPSACLGCPLYGNGQGFVPDEIREHAEVLFLAQNPGEHEENGTRVVGYGTRYGSRVTYLTEPCVPAPLIGPTGYLLEREYLPQARLTRNDISLANVLKCRMTVNGKRTNDMPVGKTLQACVTHCTRAYLKIPSSVRLVVAMGAHAWRFLHGPGTITDWRGFLAPGDTDTSTPVEDSHGPESPLADLESGHDRRRVRKGRTP